MFLAISSLLSIYFNAYELLELNKEFYILISLEIGKIEKNLIIYQQFSEALL